MKCKLFRMFTLTVLLLWAPLACASEDQTPVDYAAFTIFQTSRTNVVNVDIVATYGATCNGVVSDKAAFDAFNAAWQGSTSQVRLTIPTGKICCASPQSISPYKPFAGIPNLVVSGYGATIVNFCSGTGDGATWQFGGAGEAQNWTHSARTQSVSAGASTLTLVTAGDTSLFSVGQRVLLAGIDLMGTGYPINNQIFEYLTVQSIGVGTITFTTTLVNSYLSTWPHYNDGSISEIDQGGPATLYSLDTTFNATVEYQGLTIDQATVQTYAVVRNVTYRDVTFTGNQCSVPTQNESFNAINVTGTLCAIEVDKMITAMTVTGGTWTSWEFQSASTGTATFNGGVVISGYIHGTPQVFVGNNMTVQGEFKVGAEGFGASSSVSCTSCVINALGTFGAKSPTTDFTLSSGTIVKNNATTPIYWCVPGFKAYFSGEVDFEYPMFTITGLTKSGSNTLCATTLSGSSFPALPPNLSGVLYIQVDPAPIINFQSSTGNATVVDVSQASARNKPIWTYTSRTYTCAFKRTGDQIDINSPDLQTPVWGEIDDGGTNKITIAVSTADTSGTSPLTFSPLKDTASNGMPYVGADLVVHHLPTTVNLKIAGTRVINQSSVTGAQSGDLLSAPNDPGSVLSGRAVAPATSTTVPNAATCPVVTVTVETTR